MGYKQSQTKQARSRLMCVSRLTVRGALGLRFPSPAGRTRVLFGFGDSLCHGDRRGLAPARRSDAFIILSLEGADSFFHQSGIFIYSMRTTYKTFISCNLRYVEIILVHWFWADAKRSSREVISISCIILKGHYVRFGIKTQNCIVNHINIIIFPPPTIWRYL